MGDFSGFGNDLQLLSELLNPKREDESSDDEEHVTKKSTNTYLTPADIGKSGNIPEKPKEPLKPSPYEKIKEKTLAEYEDETLGKVDEITDGNTWKKTPKWEISYRQSVSASDIYLQMGNKTPTTASCENMIVKIELPGERRQTIDLKILQDQLELTSSLYYLKIPLPQTVNPQLGDAKFDNDTESLLVTLVMDREFDFINF